ncbi:MAG: FtsB family cell division protein [Acidimicrobiales bacterium]
MKSRAGLIFASIALVGVLGLAVFPAQAWRQQRQERDALSSQEAVLVAENQALQARADQLRTDEEIERLARQYNLVKPGEEAYFILPEPTVPAEPAPTAAPSPQPSPSLWDRITSIF